MIVAIGLLALIDRIHPLHPRATGRSTSDVARYHDKTFRVTRVVDGDTLRIAAPDGDKPYTVVRLWGVDTPEVYGRTEPAYFGPEASEFVHSLASDQQVRLELWGERTRGYYGRLLAYVYLPDGTMLNERIIEAGYGYADWRFDHPYMDRFKSAERRARKAKAGLWKNVTPEKMPKWRRRQRTSSCTDWLTASSTHNTRSATGASEVLPSPGKRRFEFPLRCPGDAFTGLVLLAESYLCPTKNALPYPRPDHPTRSAKP